MAIDISLYDTATLLGVMEEMEPASTYFRDMLYTSVVTSDNEYIDFEKITNDRKLAPFVTPLAQGKPIYDRTSNVTRLKPAYIKPKDSVTAARMLRKQPGQLLNPTTQNPGARMDAVVADIMSYHRTAIERRWEWMAAQAALTGKVLLSGEDYEEHEVDFGRASDHTVVLTGADAWDDAGADPITDLNDWIERVQNAEFGGPVDRVTFGAGAWRVFSRNSEVRKQLDTQVRGTEANFKTGLVTGENVKFMGRIGFVELWLNTDYYEVDGVATKFMGTNDVFLSGPNMRGVQAFGAILDKGADLRPLPIFPKMWNQEDPSVTFVMSQSAPLFIPVNPNATLLATVLE